MNFAAELGNLALTETALGERSVGLLAEFPPARPPDRSRV
jgi:hypothetical protein